MKKLNTTHSLMKSSYESQICILMCSFWIFIKLFHHCPQLFSPAVNSFAIYFVHYIVRES